MKYLNTKDFAIDVEFREYPTKTVQPGAVINLSESKYNNLKNKSLKELGFRLIKASAYQKFMKTNEYARLVSLRKKKQHTFEEINPNALKAEASKPKGKKTKE